MSIKQIVGEALIDSVGLLIILIYLLISSIASGSIIGGLIAAGCIVLRGLHIFKVYNAYKELK